jgi:hypothetical protein
MPTRVLSLNHLLVFPVSAFHAPVLELIVIGIHHTWCRPIEIEALLVRSCGYLSGAISALTGLVGLDARARRAAKGANKLVEPPVSYRVTARGRLRSRLTTACDSGAQRDPQLLRTNSNRLSLCPTRYERSSFPGKPFSAARLKAWSHTSGGLEREMAERRRGSSAMMPRKFAGRSATTSVGGY